MFCGAWQNKFNSYTIFIQLGENKITNFRRAGRRVGLKRCYSCKLFVIWIFRYGELIIQIYFMYLWSIIDFLNKEYDMFRAWNLKNWYGVGIEKIINIIVSSSEHFVLNFVFTTTCTLLHTAHFVTSESENTLDICPWFGTLITDAQWCLFFLWNPKFLGLGRQIGQILFGVFSAEL